MGFFDQGEEIFLFILSQTSIPGFLSKRLEHQGRANADGPIDVHLQETYLHHLVSLTLFDTLLDVLIYPTYRKPGIDSES